MSWRQFALRGDSAFQRGLYDAAEIEYQRAIVEAQQLTAEDPDLAGLYRSLAAFYFEKGQFALSHEWAKRALDLDESYFGPLAEPCAEDSFAVALACHRLEQFTAAQRLYEQALLIRKNYVGGEHHQIARMLAAMTLAYIEEGRHRGLEAIAANMLHQRDLFHSGEDLAKFLGLKGAVEFYKRQERMDEVDLVFQRTLDLSETLKGRTHPDTRSVMMMYSDFMKETNRGMASWKMRVNFVHAEKQESQIDRARTHMLKGQLHEAERLYRRELMVAVAKFGPKHEQLAKMRLEYADVLHALGRYPDAEFMRLQAANVGSAGSELTDSLSDVATLALWLFL